MSPHTHLIPRLARLSLACAVIALSLSLLFLAARWVAGDEEPQVRVDQAEPVWGNRWLEQVNWEPQTPTPAATLIQ